MQARHFTDIEQVLAFKRNVVAALSDVPGVREVTVFGSCGDGRCDQYSDLDIRVTTVDIDLTRARLSHALSGVDTLELIWILEDARDDWAATLVFRHLSPMHKLDLSIGSTHAHRSSHDRCRATPTPGVEGTTGAWSGAYRPPIGSLDHYVISQLLGTTRYAKARQRDHVLSCWRFASALANAVIALSYSGIADGEWKLATLTSEEYRIADLRLDPSERSCLIAGLDFSNSAAMDRTVVRLLHQLITTYQARKPSTPIPDRLLGRLSACAEDLLR